jgi:hypothetical protein
MSKKLFFNVSFFTLFILSHSVIQAQRFDSLLNTLNTKYPQEKIHLHIDKSYYNPGETIWFKAYIINSNFSAALSTTMYADLIDDKGNVLQRKTMPILEGGAASAFDLTDANYSSQVYIRAYTAWMLNFDSSLLCTKAITIVPKQNAVKKSNADTYSLTLFPEGGDLIEGVQSNIAFKATDQNGKPIDVSGTITDAAGKKVESFTSIHDGMGYFALRPEPNEKYTAVWKDKKGIMHNTSFPTIKKEGVALAVSNTDQGLYYTLSRSATISAENRSFSVVAQMFQQSVYSAKINMSNKIIISAPIKTDSLSSGILQITVFNELDQPVAERIVFINHENDFAFMTDLHVVDKNLTKRAHNSLQVDIGGELRSNISIAVTDADLNPISKNEENILSDLLLSSDLKGYIYNPAYYFNDDADSIKQHLDLVMMTNGWRRFKWEDVLAGKFPQLNYTPENFLSIKGSVFGLTKNQAKGRELIASIKSSSSSSNFFTIPMDENGMFNMNGLYFFDTTKIYYQINNDKDKKLTDRASFKFDNNFIKEPGISSAMLQSIATGKLPDSSIIAKSNVLAALRRSQFEKDKAKTLQVVTVTAKQKTLAEKLDEKLTSGLFSGGDARIFTLEDDPVAGSIQNVLSYLQGKVAGLQISTVGDGGATWRGSATSFFLDENTVDVQTIQSLSMGDISMIKIFDPPFMGAAGGGAGGAIAIYSKRGGGTAKYANLKGLNTVTLYGYSPIKEFYSPDYEKANDPTASDSRITLYWNPFILMDAKKRRVVIPFYNSDGCKKIRVVIEGINENGQLTREEKVFE